MKDLHLKDLKRIETAVIAAVLLLALAWFVLNQQVGSARDDYGLAERKLSAVKSNFNVLNSGEEKAALDKQLQELQAGQSSVVLPPRSDALNFGAELANYVSDNKLALQSMETKDSTIALDKIQRPAIAYSVVLTGGSQELVGALSLLNRFSSASVQSLSLSKDKEGTQWKLNLNVAVVY